MRSKKFYLFLLSLAFFFFYAPPAEAAAPLLVALGVFAGIPLLLAIIKLGLSITAFLWVIGHIHSISGRLIDWAIFFQNNLFNLPVIQNVWTIFRDLVNMLFILILVIIAFATIFNYPTGYRYKELLPKLIITALLINFSLVIAIWVIDILWVPAQVFLNSLTQPEGSTVSGKIADALNITKFFDTNFLKNLVAIITTGPLVGGAISTVEEIFRAIIFTVEAFIYAWIALILWVRIPILIGLITISPLAWLGYTVPNIRENTWGAWWSKLLCWAVIPIPLFGVIYFAALFSGRIFSEIGNLNPELPALLRIPLDFIGFETGQFIAWLLTVGVFLGGLMYVKNLSCSFYGAVALGFSKTWRGIRGSVGKTVDFAYTATGAAGAVKGVKGRMLEEGIPFLGTRRLGAEQLKQREAGLEDILTGTAGLAPKQKAEIERLKQSEKAQTDIENRIKTARIQKELNSIVKELRTKVRSGAKDPETLAAISVLAKRGELDVDLFNQAVNNFKDMPLALSKVMSEWKEGKFGGVRADELISILKDIKTPLEAKRIGYNFIASDDGKRVVEDKSFGYAEFKEMYEILGGRNTKDGRTAKKFVGEIKPTIVGEYNFNLPTTEFDDPADYPADVADAILKQIKKTGSKDFTKYGKDIWNNPEFKSALGDLLYSKATTDIGNARKYAEEVRKWLIRESKDEDELRIFNDAATMAGI